MISVTQLAEEVDAKRNDYLAALDRLRSAVTPIQAPQTIETFPREASRKTIANRASLLSGHPKKTRRKAPVQLCPVPRCVNRAAPSLGMVCMKHRSIPKATIKKYREARRARKD